MFVQNVNGSRADITSGAALERGSSTSTDVDTRPETSAPGGVEKLLTTKRPSTALIASNVAVNVPDTSGATSTLVQSTSGDLGDGNSLFSCSISVRPRSPTTPRKKNHYHPLFFFFLRLIRIIPYWLEDTFSSRANRFFFSKKMVVCLSTDNITHFWHSRGRDFGTFSKGEGERIFTRPLV